MVKNIWIPMVVQLACCLTTIAAASILPETRPFNPEYQPLRKTVDEDHLSEEEVIKSVSAPWQVDLPILRHCLNAATTIFSDRNTAFLVITFLVSTFSRQSIFLILQYVSKRFGWTVAKVRILLYTRHQASVRF